MLNPAIKLDGFQNRISLTKRVRDQTRRYWRGSTETSCLKRTTKAWPQRIFLIRGKNSRGGLGQFGTLGFVTTLRVSHQGKQQKPGEQDQLLGWFILFGELPGTGEEQLGSCSPNRQSPSLLVIF